MKFEQTTPVLLPVYGKAAESLKRTLEKPSCPKPITQEEQETFNYYFNLITKKRREQAEAKARGAGESL